jgi:GNAT superfamily N-acetyltransferase
VIRPLVRADLEAALALQALGYAEALRDGPEAFASRIDIAPDHCRAVERGGRLLAWLLSHPWRSFDPPTPDQVLTPGGDACWYIHDLSVAPEGRGLGLGRALVEHVLARCRPARSELIAVSGARPVWLRLGWRDAPDLPPALAAKVAAYGPEAAYMVRVFGGEAGA